MKKHGPMLWVITILVATSLSCYGLGPDPQTARKYPWLVQPLRAETRAYFCQKLDLQPDHRICRQGTNVLASDLVPVLQERFPPNKTFYSEVAHVLKGYPVEVEESITPDGIVTSRRYVYLLTEFDGFCVDFYTDLQTELVKRIGSSSIGSGPTPATCGSEKLRAQPRPFLSTGGFQNTLTPIP